MKALKVLIFFLVIQLISALISCCKEVSTFRFVSVKLISMDNSGKEPVESSSKKMKATAFAIRSTLNFKEYYAVNKLGFITSAMATKCRSRLTIQSPLESIEIVTINNYDSNHLAGSDVTSYFVSRKSDDTAKNYSPISVLITDINSSELIYSTLEQTTSFDFFLIQSPKLDSLCSFKFIFTFQDTLLTEQSDTLILK